MKKIISHFLGKCISSNSPEAFFLFKKSNFGERINDKIQYSFSEALYLLEKKNMEIFQKKVSLKYEGLIKKIIKLDKRIQIKYPVFKDLRGKGYVVKTALKFGGDFRVYPKGSKIGKKHSTWIVFVDSETNKLTWHDFSSKNRVAHSTKKNLLLAIVDDEEGISYYEVKWLKT
ncbi:MAG: tRNA-intron lyase [Candidatus Pacearchaeota archaeon]